MSLCSKDGIADLIAPPRSARWLTPFARTYAQEKLENAVIDAVLGNCKRDAGEQGRLLLVKVVRDELGIENEAVGGSRRRLEKNLARIGAATRRLLDNITPAALGRSGGWR